MGYLYTVTNGTNVDQEITLDVDAVWPTEVPDSLGVLEPGASASVPVTVTIPLMPDVIFAADTFNLIATGSVGGVGVATGTTQAKMNPADEVLPQISR